MYFHFTEEKIYFSGIVVSAYYDKSNQQTYFNDPKLFFQNGQLAAETKSFFLQRDVLIEEGKEFSFVGKDAQGKTIYEKKFNIIPNKYFSTVYYTATGHTGEVENFVVLIYTVLKYSDQIKKVQFYKGSVLLDETEVKKSKDM